MRAFLSYYFIAIIFTLTGSAFSQDCGTLTLRADISGDGVYGNTISPGQPVSIDIYSHNLGGIDPRTVWSSPFIVTTSNYQAVINWSDSSQFPQAEFLSLWYSFSCVYVENWDGISPDLFNFTGIGIPPASSYPGNMDEILALKLSFKIACTTYSEGNLCIEQGDPINNIYDWLFENPVPTFAKTCWPIAICPCGPTPTIDSCKNPIFSGVLQSSTHQFHATPAFYGIAQYVIVSGPGAIDGLTGLWSYTPPLQQAWQKMPLVVQVFDSMYYHHSCPDGRDICSTQVAIYGVCGDADGNGTVNIRDITRQIQCIYLNPPSCQRNPGFDTNGNGVINVQDITYLINFLYKGGPNPSCYWDWSAN